MSINFYEFLGVKSDASIQEIKSAFNKLVRLYHSDKNLVKNNRQMIILNEAYAILRDTKKRKEYDQSCNFSNDIPNLVVDLKIIWKDEDNIELSWTHINPSVVNIYMGYKEVNFVYGQKISDKDIKNLGERILKSNASSGICKIIKPGIIYFYPVIKYKTKTFFSKSISEHKHQDIKNIRYFFHNHEILLQWDWPKEIKEITIAYKDNDFPKIDNDPDSTIAKINRSEYDSTSGFKLKYDGYNKIFLSLFIIKKNQSHGTIGARKLISINESCILNYRISEKKNWFKSSNNFSLTIKVKKVIDIPELVLVAKKKHLPMDQNGGDILLTIPAQTNCCPKKNLVFEFKGDLLKEGWRPRLFFSDDSYSEKIRLEPYEIY